MKISMHATPGVFSVYHWQMISQNKDGPRVNYSHLLVTENGPQFSTQTNLQQHVQVLPVFKRPVQSVPKIKNTIHYHCNLFSIVQIMQVLTAITRTSTSPY